MSDQFINNSASNFSTYLNPFYSEEKTSSEAIQFTVPFFGYNIAQVDCSSPANFAIRKTYNSVTGFFPKIYRGGEHVINHVTGNTEEAALRKTIGDKAKAARAYANHPEIKNGQMYNGIAEAREAQLAARKSGDKVAATFYRTIAEAYEDVAGNKQVENISQKIISIDKNLKEAHQKIQEVTTQKNPQTADAYGKNAKACQIQMIIARGQKDKIADSKIVIYRQAADAYEKAQEAEAKNNSAVAKLYCRCAQAHEASVRPLEKQTAAFKRSDKTIYDLQKTIVEAYKNVASNYNNWAHEAQEENNSPAAELYYNCAQAYEAQVRALENQAMALERGDETVATLQGKIATTYESAAWGYTRIHETGQRNNGQVAGLYRKIVQLVEPSVRTLEKQIAAFGRGDKTAAAFQEKIAETYENAVCAYYDIKEIEEKNNFQVAEFPRKRAQAYEALATSLEKQADALERGDKTAAALQEKIGEAYKSAIFFYDLAQKSEGKNNVPAAALHRKRAQAYEAQAATLGGGDEATITIQEEIIKLYEAVASHYWNAQEAKRKHNPQEVEFYSKIAQLNEAQVLALEKQVAALERNDIKSANTQENIADALLAATQAYILAQKESDVQQAEGYRNIASAHEAQAEAWKSQL